MPGLAQEAGPALRGVAVAVARAGTRGGDDGNAGHGAGLDLSGMLADAAALERDLLDARARAIRVTADLDGERLLGPKLAIVNPPLWEIGHVAWFQEHWCLRWRADGTLADSILPGADALYDSSAVAHDTRWNLPLPDLKSTRAYGERVLERVRERLARESRERDLQYFVRLATFHEDMHAEAFLYTRQTLGYPEPAFDFQSNENYRGDIEFAGGTFMLGAEPSNAFVFDNEKWAHEVDACAVPHRALAGEQRAVPGICRGRRQCAAVLEEGGRPMAASGASIAGCRSRRTSRCAT